MAAILAAWVILGWLPTSAQAADALHDLVAGLAAGLGAALGAAPALTAPSAATAPAAAGRATASATAHAAAAPTDASAIAGARLADTAVAVGDAEAALAGEEGREASPHVRRTRGRPLQPLEHLRLGTRQPSLARVLTAHSLDETEVQVL
jgi:hypothetical protein